MNLGLVDAAMVVALEAHGEQRNKHDGEMYNLHLARVWINCRDAGGTLVQQAIAWLHDSLEDTNLTANMLETMLCSFGCDYRDVADVLDGVEGMTKRTGETDRAYYERCRDNDNSRFVKLRADFVDNFRRNHTITDDATKLRMATKYSLGLDILS